MLQILTRDFIRIHNEIHLIFHLRYLFSEKMIQHVCRITMKMYVKHVCKITKNGQDILLIQNHCEKFVSH